MITIKDHSFLYINDIEQELQANFLSTEYEIKRPWLNLFGEHIWVRRGPVAAVVTLKSSGEIRVRGQVNFQHRPLMIILVISLLIIRIIGIIVWAVCYFKYKEEFTALEQSVADCLRGKSLIDEIGKPETVSF